jgi:hypothetical protein
MATSFKNRSIDKRREDSMQISIEVAAAIQRIVRADVSQVKFILASEPQGIRETIVSEFRNNKTLRNLFPEFVEPVTSAA